MTRTRKVKMKLVVTISQVSLWSSALWLCRFDGLDDWYFQASQLLDSFSS